LSDITFLELFTIVVAIQLWGHRLNNHKVLFRCDNQAVVTILNTVTSRSPRVVALVRPLVLKGLQLNIVLKSSHVPGKINRIADLRFDLQTFRRQAPEAEAQLTTIRIRCGTTGSRNSEIIRQVDQRCNREGLSNSTRVFCFFPRFSSATPYLASFITASGLVRESSIAKTIFAIYGCTTYRRNITGT
jgi:hypothetical protein